MAKAHITTPDGEVCTGRDGPPLPYDDVVGRNAP